MFGYVKIHADELKIKDYKQYKDYYCTLCKQIGCYSQIARLMLSYDMVFLSVLYESQIETNWKKCNCKFLKKCRKQHINDKTKYIAAVSLMLLYYKLQNDVYDGSKKSKYLLVLIKNAFKKAVVDYPEINDAINASMMQLYTFEKAGERDFKKLEHCFAAIFYKVFELSPEQDMNSSLKGEISYHIASWIYWFDMLCDVEEDKKESSFNLILLDDTGKARREIEGLIEYHMEQMVEKFALLPYFEGSQIVENILLHGIPNQYSAYLEHV